MSDASNRINYVRGIAGAVIGGLVGYYAFFWIARQGFYGMILPGALLGLGCGLLSKGRSVPLGVLCGVAALFLGLFTEWCWRPFIADDGFPYFLTHAHELKTLTLIMIGLGALFAFWFGVGRQKRVWKREDRRPSNDETNAPSHDHIE